jgi:uncharacterized protein (DUF302 family)
MKNSYYFNTISQLSFEDAILKVTEDLQKYGFGIISDIDVTSTFKKKLNLDFKKYRILGACHAPSAYKAIEFENKIGTMLPCNVIIQQLDSGQVEVTAIDPIASMMAVKNENLVPIAIEISEKLRKFIENF